MSGAPQFLALTGPTASGKTKLSIAVGQRMPIEVISMDSRQVYRNMDIATDKVCAADQARVPHHGLAVLRVRCAVGLRRFVEGLGCQFLQGVQAFS